MLRSAVTALLMCQFGCAYAFTYGGGSPDKPQDHVVVQPFVDQTSEGRAGALVTNRLRERLGPPDATSPRLALEGEVVGIETGNLPVARPGGVAAGIGILRVRGVGRLRDKAGNIIFETGVRVGSSEFTIGSLQSRSPENPHEGTVSQTEDMRRLAMERACAALADEIAEAVMNR